MQDYKMIKKHIETRKLRKHIAELLSKYPDKIMLNIGCGTDYKEGWINVDNNSDHNIKEGKLDLDWDLRNYLPFEDNSVDFIFHEHFIEHLTPEEGVRVTRDFLRVLKPGGVLRIATPDMKTAVSKYLHLPLDKDPTLKTFGLKFKTRGERLNAAFSKWGHKWLYDWEELERRLLEAGCNKKKVKKCDLRKSKYKELNGLETREESKLIAEITK